jgi:hypothetical protein
MTLFAWAMRAWRTATPVQESPTSGITLTRPKPRVPDEYLGLYTFLEHRYASMVVLTFDQMESLLGHALPAPASTTRGWWTDDAGGADRQADTWTAARRTATPNLTAGTVTFERLP